MRLTHSGLAAFAGFLHSSSVLRSWTLSGDWPPPSTDPVAPDDSGVAGDGLPIPGAAMPGAVGADDPPTPGSCCALAPVIQNAAASASADSLIAAAHELGWIMG